MKKILVEMLLATRGSVPRTWKKVASIATYFAESPSVKKFLKLIGAFTLFLIKATASSVIGYFVRMLLDLLFRT